MMKILAVMKILWVRGWEGGRSRWRGLDLWGALYGGFVVGFGGGIECAACSGLW